MKHTDRILELNVSGLSTKQLRLYEAAHSYRGDPYQSIVVRTQRVAQLLDIDEAEAERLVLHYKEYLK